MASFSGARPKFSNDAKIKKRKVTKLPALNLFEHLKHDRETKFEFRGNWKKSKSSIILKKLHALNFSWWFKKDVIVFCNGKSQSETISRELLHFLATTVLQILEYSHLVLEWNPFFQNENKIIFIVLTKRKFLLQFALCRKVSAFPACRRPFS